MADAFSIFDYGGSMGFTAIVSWGSTIVVFIFFMMGVGVWVGANRVVALLGFVANLLGRQILGISRMDYGFSLLCVSLFFYLCFLGISSIFPYSFCLTSHFSHNFCISMVLWFSTLIFNLIISVKGFASHLVPSGLSWYQAAPVGVFEMISNLSRFVTLGARLTMNMIAGKLLLCVGSAFLGALMVKGGMFVLYSSPLALLLLCLMGWEMVVGIIQAYIFTFLSSTYVNEAPVEGGGH